MDDKLTLIENGTSDIEAKNDFYVICLKCRTVASIWACENCTYHSYSFVDGKLKCNKCRYTYLSWKCKCGCENLFKLTLYKVTKYTPPVPVKYSEDEPDGLIFVSIVVFIISAIPIFSLTKLNVLRKTSLSSGNYYFELIGELIVFYIVWAILLFVIYLCTEMVIAKYIETNKYLKCISIMLITSAILFFSFMNKML